MKDFPKVLDSVSAVFLVRKDGSLLLQLRDEKPGIHRPGWWVIPGGHCYPNEDTLECARREFLEETLYRCDNLRFIGTILDTADEYRYWLHLYWDLYDEKQKIFCMEGQKLAFIERSKGREYLKLDFLLNYWDSVIESIKMSDE